MRAGFRPSCAMSNPNYKPPEAEVRDGPRPRGSAIKGLLAGLAVDIAGTIAVGIVIGIGYAAVLGAGGRSEAEIRDALANASADGVVSGIGVIGGCAFSILGGYVCERIARRGDYRLGFVLGLLSVGTGFAMAGAAMSLPESLLLSLLTIGSVLLGTRLALERRARASAQER